jgi:hypothetical protein
MSTDLTSLDLTNGDLIDQDLIKSEPTTQALFEMGFLPLPGQTEEAYRKTSLRHLKRHQLFQKYLKTSLSDVLLAGYQIEGPLSYFHALWRVRPFWITALFSKTSMSPFHLGALCSELFEAEEIHFIQIHSRMAVRNHFWGYKRDLIFVHELIHLLRLGLDKGPFEEFIAYDSDPLAMRRFLGPFFSSSWMPALFISQLWFFFVGSLSLIDLLPEICFLDSSCVCYGLILIAAISFIPWAYFLKHSYIWHRFQKKIKSSPWAASRRAIILGLHEKEIRAFSGLDVSDWKSYVQGLSRDLYQKRLSQLLS